MTADLAAFLRARLDDTAKLAQAYIDRREHEGTDRETWAYKLLLADIDAKRRIIDLHSECHRCPTGGEFLYYCPLPDPPNAEATSKCPTLRLLALPWRDHPDYRQEWTV